MKELKCPGCGKLTAYIENGSKLRNGAVMLCADCESDRLALALAADIDAVKANRANENMSTFMDTLFKMKR